MRSAKLERFQDLEATVQAIKNAKNARFDEVTLQIEDMRAEKAVRLDKIEAAIRAEVNDRFATTQALDKKIRLEVAQVRAHCEKTAADFSAFKQKTDSSFARDLQRHMDLRHDVERLAALLSDNSMSRDPFTGLGFQSPATSKCGSPVPSCMGSSLGGQSMLPSLSGTQTLKGMMSQMPSPSKDVDAVIA